MEDIELFNRIKFRDREAFRLLFRKYYTPLCRFSFTICLSKEDAEEHIQSLFVDLWEKAKSIHIEISVKAYLYTSARNYTLNAIQKKQTELRILSEYSESTFDNESHITAENPEIAQLLRAGINTLPGKCREIFVLCKQEGLTYEEIADYLQISEKTVENQMGIALRKLREYLHPRMQKLLIMLFLYLFS